MKPWTSDEILNIVHGKLYGHAFQAVKVSTDTRQLALGDLFVALDGPNFKGSQFLDQAKENGAVAAVVNAHQDVDLPQIVVTDTLKALGQLAQARREQSHAKVIALTGTNGKTSTKEMLKGILEQCGHTLATQGNLNNDIGVPLTLLRLTADHAYAVIEMGANHIGEIAYLTDIAQPDIVAITNVSSAHLEGFGSFTGVVRAKTEIYAHSQGQMVVNIDMPCAQDWLSQFANRPITTFALDAKADVMASDITDDARSFNLVIDNKAYPIYWQLDGRHNIANALAACALAYCAGVTGETMAAALNGMALKQARLSAYQLGSHVIYDDTYNANPASFKVAIDVLQAQPRSMVIAGDMGELGQDAAKLHQQVGQYAKEKGIEAFWCIGQYAGDYATGYPQARIFTEMDEMAGELARLLDQTSAQTVLVKGSRSAQMERLFKLSGLDEQLKENS